MVTMAGQLDEAAVALRAIADAARRRVLWGQFVDTLLPGTWWCAGALLLGGLFSHRQQVLDWRLYLGLALLPLLIAALATLWHRPSRLQAAWHLDRQLAGHQLFPSAVEQALLEPRQRATVAPRLFNQALAYFTPTRLRAARLHRLRVSQLRLPMLLALAGILMYLLSPEPGASPESLPVAHPAPPDQRLDGLLALQRELRDPEPANAARRHDPAAVRAPAARRPAPAPSTSGAGKPGAAARSAGTQGPGSGGHPAQGADPGQRPEVEAAQLTVQTLDLDRTGSSAVSSTDGAATFSSGDAPPLGTVQPPVAATPADPGTDNRAYSRVQRHTIARYFRNFRTQP